MLKKGLLSLALVSQFAQAQAPENIIYIVGDGMGPEFVTAYRYFKDDPATPEVERTIFDKYLVGTASTYPAPVSGYVTDSAAGATALAAGIKTYNGAIGVDVDKKPVNTVFHTAKRMGMKTGAVVTSQVNHATPAGFIAHNESRRNYNEIADSYLDDTLEGQIKFDLLMGGGWQYFIRDDRNLVTEFKQKGFQYVDSYGDISSLNTSKPALGLFADVGLPYVLDDSDKARLSLMTKQATKQLEDKDGFFLLVEASQVDWAGHSNDIASAMHEMDDLAKTLEYLEGYVKENPDTLVILTADHSTGGMSIAANGIYEWNPEDIRNISHSPRYFGKKFVESTITQQGIKETLNLTLTEQEVELLNQAKIDALVKLENYNANKQGNKGKKPNVAYAIENALKDIIDKRTNTGWTTGGHIATDVPVIAFGHSAAVFSGNQDNTDIAKKVFKLLAQK